MEKKYLLAIENKVKELHPADSIYEWEGDTLIVKDANSNILETYTLEGGSIMVPSNLKNSDEEIIEVSILEPLD